MENYWKLVHLLNGDKNGKTSLKWTIKLNSNSFYIDSIKIESNNI